MSKILVVDDEAMVRLALKTRLAKFGHEILEADGVAAAKSLLTQYRDVLRIVILDLRLAAAQEHEGQESGLELLKHSFGWMETCSDCGRPQFYPTVVIMLTAYPSVASCRAAFLAGVFDFLDKNGPDVWDTLIERVKVALERPRSGALYTTRKWIEDHFDEISRSYPGRTLAMQGEAIIASAETVDEVRRELADRAIRPEDCLILTVPKYTNVVEGAQ